MRTARNRRTRRARRRGLRDTARGGPQDETPTFQLSSRPISHGHLISLFHALSKHAPAKRNKSNGGWHTTLPFPGRSCRRGGVGLPPRLVCDGALAVKLRRKENTFTNVSRSSSHPLPSVANLVTMSASSKHSPAKAEHVQRRLAPTVRFVPLSPGSASTRRA